MNRIYIYNIYIYRCNVPQDPKTCYFSSLVLSLDPRCKNSTARLLEQGCIDRDPIHNKNCLICFSHISSKKHSRFFVFWGSRQKTTKTQGKSLGLKPQLLQILFYCFSRGMQKSCETLLLFWVASFCTHVSKVCYPYFVKLHLHSIWYYRYTVDTLHNPK